VKPSDAQEFIDISHALEMKAGTTHLPFEEFPQALTCVKHGEIDQPNAVIIIEDGQASSCRHL
jgi:hypothetical protein